MTENGDGSAEIGDQDHWTRLYDQPREVQFGTQLLMEAGDRNVSPWWDQLDIAVAWVRASGMRHLSGGFRRFLENGGTLSVVVGIDIGNTTREGLRALLDLEQYGSCETHVRHDESGAVFHPKLYLFRNEEEARLIVGSNNLTESGLYSNVEAGLLVDTGVDHPVVVQADEALGAWRDPGGGLAYRLDAGFLERLSAGGYVLGEDGAEERRRLARRDSLPVNGDGEAGGPLFGTGQRHRPPAAAASMEEAGAAGTSGAAAEGGGGKRVLYMRLRKGSQGHRPTQTQIPLRVIKAFFGNELDLTSGHDDAPRSISRADLEARPGRPNTMKLEIPEMRYFESPVSRFDKDEDGRTTYYVYDADTPEGREIMQRLEGGFEAGKTQVSIKDVERATWWRVG